MGLDERDNAAGDRRGGDRRLRDVPFNGRDRRMGNRRSGTDRRAQTRPA